MPYQSISGLPENVKSSLDEKEQRLWMSVFNSTYKKCESEGEKDCDTRGAKAAWSVVKRQEGLSEGTGGLMTAEKWDALPEETMNPLIEEVLKGFTESSAEAVMKHFELSEEDWKALTDEERNAKIAEFKESAGEIPKVMYLFCESYHFDEATREVSGVAIHPRKIWHPEEGQTHVYLKEELKKAAESLSGKPFGEDHLRLLPKPNIVEKSWWDEDQDGVAFKGTVTESVAKKIKDKEYKGLSIELNWFKQGVILEKVNGLAPRNFDFTSCHFMKRFPPADKEAYVKMWEGIVIPVVPPPIDIQIDQIRQAMEERISYLEGQVTAMATSPAALQSPAPAIIIFKETEAKLKAEITKLRESLKLLDKLKEGYQVERVKQEQTLGTNAQILATKITEYQEGIDLLNERLKNYQPESETIKDLRKELFQAKESVNKLEQDKETSTNAFKQKYQKLRNGIIETIPPPAIWMSWKAGGPKIMVQRQLGVLGIKPEDYYG